MHLSSFRVQLGMFWGLNVVVFKHINKGMFCGRVMLNLGTFCESSNALRVCLNSTTSCLELGK